MQQYIYDKTRTQLSTSFQCSCNTVTIHASCLTHLNISPEQQKNKVIARCCFAGVDTKITNVGISIKSTGFVFFL